MNKELQKLPFTLEWVARPKALQPRIIEAYEIRSDYMQTSDAWSVTVSDDDSSRLRNFGLEPVRLLLHGAPQVLGWVEGVRRGGARKTVQLSGRDHLSRLLECDVDPACEIKDSMKLFDAVIQVAAPCGVDAVFDNADYAQVRNARTGRSPTGQVDRTFRALKPGDMKPSEGVSVHEFLAALVARHGATIQPHLDWNAITLARPNYSQDPVFTAVRTFRGAGNTVLTSEAEEDYSSFPTVGLVTGKAAQAGEKPRSNLAEYDVLAALDAAGATSLNYLSDRMISRRRKPSDAPYIGEKLYRLAYVNDKMARNADQIDQSMARYVADKLKDTLSYQATVHGHRDDADGVFAPDTIIDVQDEVCDLRERLWVAGVTHRGSGASITTTLQCWRPGSFVI